MPMTRRQALKSASAAVLASSIAKPAIAQKSPIQIGYLPALTGPSSSTGVGINRGTQLAVEEINKAGGIDGRQIELITRDTQSDPTKAVNGAAELTRGAKVSVVFGPVNSGESLAVSIHARGQLEWDVQICGQTTLRSGQTKALLDKPEYWSKVYPNNFRPVCYGAGGKLPDRTNAFLDRLKSAKLDMGDTLLWWI